MWGHLTVVKYIKYFNIWTRKGLLSPFLVLIYMNNNNTSKEVCINGQYNN